MNEFDKVSDPHLIYQENLLKVLRVELPQISDPAGVANLMYEVSQFAGKEGTQAFNHIRLSIRNTYYHDGNCNEDRQELQDKIDQSLLDDPKKQYYTMREIWLACIQRMEVLFGGDPDAEILTFNFINGKFYEHLLESNLLPEDRG